MRLIGVIMVFNFFKSASKYAGLREKKLMIGLVIDYGIV